ncbi:MAG: PorV/PorQ family protein [Bacteroidetes bacterium]|nr:PorV/PorQ family protein [Bacteroidota bacterium]MBU1117060.1 PorV/PorQ family protein [Bacteroidota bacterium]MBU1797655.1 PorV/PorQ family protein [Bacteroidota bacterium]
MKHLKKIFILVLALTFVSYAQKNNVGTSAANFMKIGVGGKAVAMGEAFSSISDDPTALFWNPGGIGFQKNTDLNFSNTQWIFGTGLNYLGIVLPFEELGTFGISINMFTSGDIEETTIAKPHGTGRVFDASDISIGFSYAKQLTDRFSAGITLKYISESLALESSSAVAIDIGSIFIINQDYNFRMGVVVSNLGTDMKLEGLDLATNVTTDNSKLVEAELKTYSWPLPLTFRVGLASDIISTPMHRFTLAIEVNDARDFKPRESVGIEYGFNSMFYLRSGYKFNYDEESYSAGIGLKYYIESIGGITFDYAFTNLNNLGNINRFSVGLSF